ncbi:MAG: hypothetical protein ACR2F8_06150 [Caulobacteraceae bacterium]
MARTPNVADFGRYLASVEERDIDLLLMEEFHISDEFVTWFCDQIGIPGATPDGAWHSVSDTDGESDIVLRVLSGGRRIGVLIENKIAAPEQDRQAERYHLRGVNSREAGRFDEHVAVMCAPQRYLEGLAADSAYQHRVSYEAVAEWFSMREARRAAWRFSVLSEAIEQGRRRYKMVVNAVITAFHHDYWEHLQRKHRRLSMVAPGDKGGGSTWVVLKGQSFPKGVSLNHKLSSDVMDLTFAGGTVDQILGTKSNWPDDIAVVAAKGSASLRIRVPHVDMKIGVAAQIDAIDEALEAAHRLAPFATLLGHRLISPHPDSD